MDEVRVEGLIKKYQDNGEMDSVDPALVMLKQWPASKQNRNYPDKNRGLEQLINRWLEILLESELNTANRYEEFQDEDDETRKSLMHYAAELGFLQVTKTLARKCPLLLTIMTEDQLTPIKKEPCYQWNWQ